MESAMESNEEKKIFVGGINNETTEESLLQYFSRYGDVLSTIIVKDRTTGKPRGFGFVAFSDVSSARDALNDPNHILHGKEVVVNKTRRKPQQQQRRQSHDSVQSQDCCQRCLNASNTKIFVGGLPQGLTDEEFQDFFSRFGDIIDAKIISDGETGLPRGFGFITFQSEESVTNVMQQTRYEIRNRSVEVKRAVPKHLMNASHNCQHCHQNGYSGTWSYDPNWSAPHVNYTHNLWKCAFYGQNPVYNSNGQPYYALPYWAPYAQSQSQYFWPRANYMYGATGVPTNYYSWRFDANANGFSQNVPQQQEIGLATAFEELSMGSASPQSQHADKTGLNDTELNEKYHEVP